MLFRFSTRFRRSRFGDEFIAWCIRKALKLWGHRLIRRGMTTARDNLEERMLSLRGVIDK